MESSLTARRVLARAAVQAGGVAALAERLGVGPRLLTEYITGERAIPDSLFLAAIDVVLEELPQPRGSVRSGVAERGSALDS